MIANITTENGSYRLKFGQTELGVGNAVGRTVNVSFTVPHTPHGIYDVTIIDVETGESSTTAFTVLTACSVEPLLPEPPVQVEQGGKIEILVKITGGKANFEYPKIKVQTPAVNLEYEVKGKRIFTDNFGDFQGVFTYPTDFSNGANTNFTGEYKILFNGTVVGTFFVGLTDRSEYHRGDPVKVRAVDYSAYDSVNITIKLGNENVASFNWPVTGGVVDARWRVPDNALVGNYTVSITPVPASKRSAPDTQTFEVPGFRTEIFPRNLAGEAVAGVLVKIFDGRVNTTYEVESSDEGVASVWLERGEYNAKAYFKGVSVGSLTFNLTGEGRLSLPCLLTNLNITVVNAQNGNMGIPFILLNLTCSYVSDLNGERVTEPPTLYQTGITGTLQLRSMLLNAMYVVNASRYGRVFNEGNNSFSNLQATAWNNIAIVCPVKNLQINVVDAKNQPIADAFVEAQELTGGLHYSGFTDQNGRIPLNCVFGVYRVKVYYRGELLNEAEVGLFENQTLTIRCSRYNLPIHFKIVDYFGQPIPNVNVTLERNNMVLGSKLTESDGTAKFVESGGALTVKVYFYGQNQPVTSSTIFVDGERNETNPIEIRMVKYVILAGFPIETAQFAATLLVLAVVMVILALEVHGVRRLKPKKSAG
ncbi:MAG: hypothetical protein N0A00_09410 [Candidatus Bathyarchaeota archaeon]|nr:hypothetical protein [Candidatus Bathyarchaeota archaeon]